MGPGVVIISEFTMPTNNYSKTHNKTFSDYLDYISRKDAVEKEQNDFASYQDYMSNEAKTSSLFTKDEDVISIDGKKYLKEAFKKAQKNRSVLWKDVISFDNDWLEKHGVYDAKTKTLDEQKLKDVTRKAMDVMTIKERINNTTVWSAAIHYNTDNIHVHIAMVEPIPSKARTIQSGRYKGQHRGKRKESSIDTMKSTVINKIMDRSQEQKELNNIIREKIVGYKKEVSIEDKRHMKQLFKEIMDELPDGKRLFYNSQTPKMQQKINQLSELYLNKYHKKDMHEFQEKLQQEIDNIKEAYGEGDEAKKRYEDYRKTKEKDLYTRLGNTILNEVEQAKRRELKIKYRKNVTDRNGNQKGRKYRSGLGSRTNIVQSMKDIQYHLDDQVQRWKNQQEFERLQYETER